MNMETIHDQAIELLRSAQDGDINAQEDLIVIIRDTYMRRRIGRYLNRNRVVDNEDIKQEFLIGVAFGIKDARADVGDPIEYIIYKGMCRVRSYIRKHIVQSTIQICDDCGAKSRINRIADGLYQCRKCGSVNVNTVEVNDHNEVIMQTIPEDGFEDSVISELMVDDFKSTLTPGTNIYKLYELMIEQGYDRDNPMVKNYISAIAEAWGGCSNQNVVQNLKKLKARFEQWNAENCSINLVTG